MKKRFLITVVALSILLTACGSFTCDVCGQEKSGKQNSAQISGKAVVYCDACKATVESLQKVQDALQNWGK